MTARDPPFWETKPLDAMTRAEWESLCDGCGRCCLHKLRDADTDEVAFTDVGCRLLDCSTGRCSDYANRRRRIPDCVRLTPAKLAKIDWLPPTCAYRLLAEGDTLPWWHPLVSGDPATVVRAGVSVAGRVRPEREAGPLEEHLVDWPGQVPRMARIRPAPAPPPRVAANHQARPSPAVWPADAVQSPRPSAGPCSAPHGGGNS